VKRAVIVALSVGAAAYLARKVQRAAEEITPEGLGDRAAGIKHGAQIFVDDLRRAREEREAELRERWSAGRATNPPQNNHSITTHT
jgi:hypothetical protein